MLTLTLIKLTKLGINIMKSYSQMALIASCLFAFSSLASANSNQGYAQYTQSPYSNRVNPYAQVIRENNPQDFITTVPSASAMQIPAYQVNNYQITNASATPVGKPTLACVAHAANTNRVPVDLLLGVQSVERGRTGGTVSNKNSTYDIGAFQINSIHLRRVQRMGGSEYDLSNRGCFNAHVAAVLLKEALYNPAKSNWDFYSRASGYHSWTPKYNQIYRGKLVNYTRQWQSWLRANGMGYMVTSPQMF